MHWPRFDGAFRYKKAGFGDAKTGPLAPSPNVTKNREAQRSQSAQPRWA